MAKITFTAFVSDVKGKYAGSVFKGSGSGSSVQSKSYGHKKNPARLYSAKSVVGYFSQQWKVISEVDRDGWRAAALETGTADSVGVVRKLTGFQLYMKAYITRYWYGNYMEPDIVPGYNPPPWRVSAPAGSPTPVGGTVAYYQDLGGFFFDLHGSGAGHDAGIIGHVSGKQPAHLSYRKNGLMIFGASTWLQELYYPYELDRAYETPPIEIGDCQYLQLTVFDLIHFSSTSPRIFKTISQYYF
jgi:hypothetical protein